ncbi:unnamed protein product [Caenorhabditis auriculariae]|uniref:Piwi domain-containing protein n=1 Tax=Caenorhabditis auriculariae TaxID=2777116 RepID=A0A8S1GUJ4_9PELO|nr:unnamed protein product [Caenorhabditis auriculariae]
MNYGDSDPRSRSDGGGRRGVEATTFRGVPSYHEIPPRGGNSGRRPKRKRGGNHQPRNDREPDYQGDRRFLCGQGAESSDQFQVEVGTIMRRSTTSRGDDHQDIFQPIDALEAEGRYTLPKNGINNLNGAYSSHRLAPRRSNVTYGYTNRSANNNRNSNRFEQRNEGFNRRNPHENDYHGQSFRDTPTNQNRRNPDYVTPTRGNDMYNRRNQNEGVRELIRSNNDSYGLVTPPISTQASRERNLADDYHSRAAVRNLSSQCMQPSSYYDDTPYKQNVPQNGVPRVYYAEKEPQSSIRRYPNGAGNSDRGTSSGKSLNGSKEDDSLRLVSAISNVSSIETRHGPGDHSEEDGSPRKNDGDFGSQRRVFPSNYSPMSFQTLRGETSQNLYDDYEEEDLRESPESIEFQRLEGIFDTSRFESSTARMEAIREEMKRREIQFEVMREYQRQAESSERLRAELSRNCRSPSGNRDFECELQFRRSNSPQRRLEYDDNSRRRRDLELPPPSMTVQSRGVHPISGAESWQIFPRDASVEPEFDPVTSPWTTTTAKIQKSAESFEEDGKNQRRRQNQRNARAQSEAVSEPAVPSPPTNSAAQVPPQIGTPPTAEIDPRSPKSVVAAKLAPADRTNKQKFNLLSNFWDIKIGHKIVYKYDVEVSGVTKNQRKVGFTKGARDDGPKTNRQRLCLAALRAALQAYGAFRTMAATVYDGAAQLYTSEDMAEALKQSGGIFTIRVEELDATIRQLIRDPDMEHIEILIQPCYQEGDRFDIGDLDSETNPNMAELKRSRKNFLHLLTNQDASVRAGMTVFGGGHLYNMNDRGRPIGKGFEQRQGMDKGIKFIENKKSKSGGASAAMILDSKVGTFFKNQSLANSLLETVSGGLGMSFARDERGRVIDPKWTKINRYVKGLRVETLAGNMTMIASGISDVPISQLTEEPFNPKKDKSASSQRPVYVLQKFEDLTNRHYDRNLPAVVFRRATGVVFYPIEELIVSKNQRVPNQKLDIKPAPVKPELRWNQILESLAALNLHSGGSRNEFLRMFGVTLSASPKMVEGFRRPMPRVVYGGKVEPEYNQARASWESRGQKMVINGQADLIIIAHTCHPSIAADVKNVLEKACAQAGIKVGKWFARPIPQPMRRQKEFLNAVFEKASESSVSAVIFIDDRDSPSHDLLKLMERRHLVPSQQITTEVAKMMYKQPKTTTNIIRKLNLKLNGFNNEVIPEAYAKNHWMANKPILVIGYDVAHPGPQPPGEIQAKLPPSQASVVGFSFNGGVHKEAFVGDFHFQLPRSERVEDKVLIDRMKWMLRSYIKNRGVWPESILVIRDGVSEGQYQMAMEEELGALRIGCEEYGNLHGRENWSPPFGLIIVTKRNAARFFSQRNGRVENVQPLMTIDQDVVRPNVNEVYMVTSHAIQGTAKPICYQLLVNEIGIENMDAFQALLTALTYTHQINDSPISIPEPVFQADEWAKRGNNMWKVYNEYYQMSRLPHNGEYSSPPIDYDRMTETLSYWNTKFSNSRINA